MSLITYRNIVTKTYFPREIVPLAQVGSRLVDFAAAAALYALLMIYYGVAPGIWGLMVPPFFALLVLFTLGVTFATSAANVFYRDVSPGGADQPAALALPDARRVPARRGARALSAAVSPEPADRHCRRDALGDRLRPSARLGRRRDIGSR